MPAAKITRDEAVERIADVFRCFGYDGASLSEISKTTGLGRASLYHHFPGGKEEMAREVFEHLGQAIGKDILGPLAARGTPRDRLEQWAKGVARFYAKGTKNCLLGAMVLGGSSDRFGGLLSAAFQAWIDGLAQTVRDAGFSKPEARRRAENAVGRIQGALVLSRGLRDARHFQRVLAELPVELLAG
jgi:TetR/AcrR family transcriptional regulator, lmrAB and yxaGH operons repressor